MPQTWDVFPSQLLPALAPWVLLLPLKATYTPVTPRHRHPLGLRPQCQTRLSVRMAELSARKANRLLRRAFPGGAWFSSLSGLPEFSPPAHCCRCSGPRSWGPPRSPPFSLSQKPILPAHPTDHSMAAVLVQPATTSPLDRRTGPPPLPLPLWSVQTRQPEWC